MGQEESNSLARNHLQHSVLGREIRMYQWRADPNFNTHIPRVTFKSATIQHQEEIFTQFLHQQETNQYLELYKFKQELLKMPNNADNQVVIFEEYRSTLSNLTGQLNLQESIYVLYGLLTGYEQIKKVYEKIVVDVNCCFVTKEGTVRAWINPNPKDNSVWNGKYRQLTPSSSQNQIIFDIVKIVSLLALPSSKISQNFYCHLLNILSQSKYRNCSFSQLRKWINQYCYTHQIHIASTIEPKTKQKTTYGRQMRKTQTDSCASTKGIKYYFKSTVESDCTGNKENEILLRSRSLEKDKFLITSNTNCSQEYYKTQSYVKNNREQPQEFRQSKQSMQSRESQPSQEYLQQSASQMKPKKTSIITPGKYSYIAHTSNYLERPSQLGSNKEKESQFAASQGHRTSGIIWDKIDQVPSIKSGTSPIESNNFIQDSKVQFIPPETKKETILKQKPKAKNSMQVSIMQPVDQTKKSHQFSRPENKHKTTYFPKESQSVISDSQLFSRPWITTKTITRLVSDNQHDSSMQQSIADSSSEYYNGSEYSGVLTQMGRDITQKNIDGRSRTLRVSRQFQI